MSRPFSYNDEHFNLIGNVVFVHIMLPQPIARDSNLVEIPPEIYKRMLYKSNRLTLVKLKDGQPNANWVTVGTRKSLSDGKYYIYRR